MRTRLFHLVSLVVGLGLGACQRERPPTSSPLTPSKEVYHVLQQFLAADTLNQYPKFHAAYLRQDSLAGDLSIYLLDMYNSNGDVKALPLTTWQVDQKIIFVFTGLEAVASGGDTTHHHIIRETEAANRGKIWSPAFRCWRLDVQDQKVTHIDRQVPISSSSSSYPFLQLAPPPPPPKLQ
ncbi:hypothetical protein ACW9KT_20475 [Hymenobacter sp. HD11105]